jgi:hypothetical protein
MPSVRPTTISGSRPTTDNSTITLLRSRSNVGSHRGSSLQLPHKMDAAFSIRQLHWIISPSSPCGLPAFPERRVLGVSRPNSKKIAEPYPRQICDTGRPISASRNICRTLTPSSLKLGSPDSHPVPLINGIAHTPRTATRPDAGLHKPSLSTFCISKCSMLNETARRLLKVNLVDFAISALPSAIHDARHSHI